MATDVDLIRKAAERLVTSLAEDETFRTAVGREEIAKQVAEGLLIPAAWLKLGGGLELVPHGRTAAVETALASAVALLDSDLDDDAKLVALRGVLTGLGPVVAPPVTGELVGVTVAKVEEPPAEPLPEAPPVAPDPEPPLPEAVEPAEPEPEPEPPVPEPSPTAGRPEGMPAEDEDYVCAVLDCTEEITGEQAQKTWTRFRQRLCQPHFETWDAKNPPPIKPPAEIP